MMVIFIKVLAALRSTAVWLVYTAVLLFFIATAPARDNNADLRAQHDHDALRSDLAREREVLAPRCINEIEFAPRQACEARLRTIEDALRALGR